MEFLTIFKRAMEASGLECAEGLAEHFVEKHYVHGGKKFRRCHPRDVITHALDIINFEGRGRTLTEDILDHAFVSCFVENIDAND
jgi:hypothetical protein